MAVATAPVSAQSPLIGTRLNLGAESGTGSNWVASGVVNTGTIGTGNAAGNWAVGVVANNSLLIGENNVNYTTNSLLVGSANQAGWYTPNAAVFGSSNQISTGEGIFSAGVGNGAQRIAAAAIGGGNQVNGGYSAGIGYGNKVGLYSHNNNAAYSDHSLALGSYNTITPVGEAPGVPYNAFKYAFGYGNTVRNPYSVVAGIYGGKADAHDFHSTLAPVFIVGSGTSFTDLRNSIVVRKNGTVELNGGLSVTASGQVSAPGLGIAGGSSDTGAYMAVGFNSYAAGTGSIAIGKDSETYGVNSIAIGFDNWSDADGAVTLGAGNYSGLYAASIGTDNFAAAKYSLAAGCGTVAWHAGQTSVGRYNAVPLEVLDLNGNVVSDTTFDPTDDVFVVGGGDEVTRSTAMSVKANGNTAVSGSLTVAGPLYVQPSGDIPMFVP